MEHIVKNRFSPSQKVVSPQGIYPAQQQFKDDADLNSIMRKFQKTGAIDHVKIYEPEYGIATPTDYHSAMNTITRAQTMFADLPSGLRNKFHNDPAEMLEFVQNPENQEEAEQLGLTTVTPQGPVTATEPPGAANPVEEGQAGQEPAKPAEEPIVAE